LYLIYNINIGEQCLFFLDSFFKSPLKTSAKIQNTKISHLIAETGV